MANGQRAEQLEEREAIERGGKAAKIASSVLAAKSLTFIAAGVAFILVARILGPGDFGIYTLAIATAGFFGAFGDFGFSLSAVKFVSEYMEKRDIAKVKSTITNTYAAAALEGIVFTAIAFAASQYVAQALFHNAAYSIVLEVAAFTILASILWNISYSMLVGLGRGKYITLAVAAQSLMQALVSVALAVAGFGALAPIIGLEAGFFFGFLFAVVMEAKVLGVATKHMANVLSVKEMKRLFNFSLPLGISNFVTGLTGNFSTVFLGIYATSFVLGNFGVTSRVANLFDVIVGSIGFALLSLFSATLANKKSNKNVGKYYNYSIYFSLLFTAPVALYIIILSLPFSYTAFGGTYSLAPIYMAIMSVGVLLTIFSSYTTNLLVGAGKVKTYLKFNILIAIAQLVSLFLLIPSYNGLGLVVILFLIVPMITNLLFMSKAQSLFKMKIEYGRFARVLVSSIVSSLFIIPLIYIFGGYTIPLLIAAAIEQLILYPLVISRLGAIDRKNTALMEKITERIPVVGRVMRLLIAYTNIFL